MPAVFIDDLPEFKLTERFYSATDEGPAQAGGEAQSLKEKLQITHCMFIQVIL
jgi:hypothetical protein